MAHIKLSVTKAVINQVQAAGPSSRQIAVHDASPELAEAFGSATRKDCVLVPISGVFELSMGDRNAIWASHQAEATQIGDFTDLYNLLARRPGHRVRFEWETAHE